MRWRKIQRKFRRKPYILDPFRCRNYQAAKELLFAAGLPSAFEVMETARIRANRTPEEWEAMLGISQKKLMRKCRSAAPIRLGSIALLSKRVVLAVGLILFIGFFMAFTAPGRALAMSLYNAVSEIIDGVLYVRSAESDGAALSIPSVSGEAEEVLHFDTIDALADHVDYPVYYLSNGGAEIDAITLTSSINGEICIETKYAIDDSELIITQTIRPYSSIKEDLIVMEGEKKAEYLELRLNSGIIIEGAFIAQDRSFVGTTVTDAFVVNYSLNECPNKSIISRILSEIQYKE